RCRESAPFGRGRPQELALRGQLRRRSACGPLVFPRPKLRTHRRLTVRLSQGRVTACRHASAPARRPADTRRLEPDLRSVRRRIPDALAATHLTSARRRQHGVCRTLTFRGQPNHRRGDLLWRKHPSHSRRARGDSVTWRDTQAEGPHAVWYRRPGRTAALWNPASPTSPGSRTRVSRPSCFLLSLGLFGIAASQSGAGRGHILAEWGWFR